MIKDCPNNCATCSCQEVNTPEVLEELKNKLPFDFENIDQVKAHTEGLEEEFLNEAKDIDPGEFAAKLYSILVPQLEVQLPTISYKGLKRVVEALYKIPLMEFNKKLSSEEANVYAVLNRILQCKMVMEAEVLTEEYSNNNIDMALMKNDSEQVAEQGEKNE